MGEPLMETKISIGTVQPLAVKWASFLFTAGLCGLVSVAFCWSAKPGYWVGLIIAALLLAYTSFRTLYTANVYVAGSRFVIEHAVQGTLVKEGALYSRVEDAYFYYRVVFRDGTAYYFTPSFTGIWQAFIKDSQGYSNYVRGLIQAPTTAANAL
jgi:hypothetical protein